MLTGNALHSFSHKRMTIVCTGSCIWTDCHQMAPLATAKTCFLVQLTLGSLHRVFAFFNTTSRNFYTRYMLGMSILPLHQKLTFLRNGNHITELWIFQYIEILNLSTCRQFHMLTSCCQPRPFKEILTVKYLPFHRVFIFILLHIPYSVGIPDAHCRSNSHPHPVVVL